MPPGAGDGAAPVWREAGWTLARIAEAVAIVGPDGRHLHVNPAAAAILDQLSAHPDGRPISEVLWGAVDTDGAAVPNDGLPSEVTRLTGAERTDVELGLPDARGDLRWLRISTRRLSDGAPPFGVVVSFADVTESRRIAAELRHAQERYRTVVESLHEGVIIQGADGRVVASNRRAEEVLGLSAEQLSGTSAFDPRWRAIHSDGTVWTPGEHPSARALATGEPQVGELMGVGHAEGDLRWVVVNAVPIRDGAGAVAGVVVSFVDVTERHAIEAELARSVEALRRATEQFSSAFSHAPIGMCLVGTDGRFLRVNRSLCELVGYPEDRLLTMTFQDITHPDDLDADLALVEEMLRGTRSSYTMEKRYIHADGREIWILLAVSLVHDDDGAPLHFISQIQDITERRELEARLREQAERDPLTGLFNRRRFDEEMRRQIARTGRTGEPAMLAVLDLDHFKRVNDAEGHLAGDNLLRAVSEALSGRLRRTDVLVRMGGDEFAAILVGADEEGGAATARMLVSAVRDVVSEGRVVTASVGLARIEADDDPAAVLARADAAMYAAKAAGRGVVRIGAEPD